MKTSTGYCWMLQNEVAIAQHAYVTMSCWIQRDVDESFDDTTKHVIIHDVESLIGRSKWLNERQKTRDLCLDLIAKGLS